MSSFTHPQVVANHKYNAMEVNGAKVPNDLQNIFLCVQQKKEIHATIWGRVNDDRIYLFLGEASL